MSRILTPNYYDEPITEEDFIQIAVDYYGSAVRDNSRAQLIAIGRAVDAGETDD